MQAQVLHPIVTSFPDYVPAETTARKRTAAGFGLKGRQVVGKGFWNEATVAAFVNMDDWLQSWRSRGVVWGGRIAQGVASVATRVPKEAVPQYETAITADTFIVMAQGKIVLQSPNPSRMQLHSRSQDFVTPGRSAAQLDGVSA